MTRGSAGAGAAGRWGQRWDSTAGVGICGVSSQVAYVGAWPTTYVAMAALPAGAPIPSGIQPAFGRFCLEGAAAELPPEDSAEELHIVF